jgi:hypothetical protein
LIYLKPDLAAKFLPGSHFHCALAVSPYENWVCRDDAARSSY